jgi:predicted PurR-regulated permease PerM
MPSNHRDLPRTVLGVLALLAMIAAALWILRPFLLAIVWATMIVVATWPLMIGLQRRLAGRRSLAVAAMCVILVMFLLVPLLVAVVTLATSLDEIPRWVVTLKSMNLPEVPAWLVGIPLVGSKVASFWHEIVSAGADGLVARLSPYGAKIAQWLVSEAGSLGYMLIQFLLIVAIAGILYAQGETAAASLRRFGHRLAGDRGEGAVVLGGQAIRSVALGIGVTALLQSILGGIGLAAAGVPFAGPLTALMLLLCLAQIGVVPVLLAAVGWLYYKDHTITALLLLVWTVIVGSLDNVVRPMLIKRGVDLPMLVILAGVIGGLLTFGIIGLFVGPVVLAVNYTLWRDWVNNAPPA